MDVWPRRPAENEESCWKENRSTNSGNETMFLLSQTVLDIVWDHVPVQIREVDDKCEGGSDLASQERD